MTDLPVLSPAEARVLGCLIEKKELTPDVYPLTLNGAHQAANQKTAREPVMALELTEVRRALSQLEQKGLVRQAFASRVERYEHLMAQRFSLTTPQIAVIGLLLLRGAQTAHELLARSERMARFASIEELRDNLDLMIGRRPPLVQLLERAPGQREERYVHLLSGPVEPAAVSPWQPTASALDSDLEARVKALEEEVAALRAKIEALGG
ncbi:MULTISPECIES: DUF480 domain-containing protein [unclassified Mesorhizobium]|uniref:YceH family protein n=1 Tax=unclassified Mesorhizobium TaxID=325217 RepID=UPI000FCB9DE3|nr:MULTISPECIES: DUF480 domain-containing protein [unclassified Mesorhizobium]TGP22068.1 DUF480 domain-containing protein [Mesorhizobium sp. M1D.F.Ca.ET.231.01.1.1]TGP30453.1 DUF480 domain-containing protein [Mesorhizobium sp. M1D.F.Ca.ET.234.01.1.1]TGS44529.1 DUF480 domain-containing protein [Mesorhizobium sp. M1D.F.Ca.ET.184.01.1.1]TGS60569.1 DUF480 domain-containing protein [Mesorhizobium sp. M1D.F.Ca.ET.183.01.1.1]